MSPKINYKELVTTAKEIVEAYSDKSFPGEIEISTDLPCAAIAHTTASKSTRPGLTQIHIAQCWNGLLTITETLAEELNHHLNDDIFAPHNSPSERRARNFASTVAKSVQNCPTKVSPNIEIGFFIFSPPNIQNTTETERIELYIQGLIALTNKRLRLETANQAAKILTAEMTKRGYKIVRR